MKSGRYGGASFVFVSLMMSLVVAISHQSSLLIHSQRPSSLQVVVSLRGGGGPLNPKRTAQAMALLIGAQGCNNFVATAAANEGFGFESNNVNLFYRRRAGINMISASILMWELVGGSAVTKAAGLSLLPLILEIIRALASNDADKVGLANVQEIPVTLDFLVVLSCLTGSKHAEVLLKVLTVWKSAYGLFGMVVPKQVLDFFLRYKFNPRYCDASTRIAIRLLGATMLGQAVLLACRLWRTDVEATVAVGFAIAVFFVCEILLFLNEFKEVKVKAGPELFWILVEMIMMGTLLL